MEYSSPHRSVEPTNQKTFSTPRRGLAGSHWPVHVMAWTSQLFNVLPRRGVERTSQKTLSKDDLRAKSPFNVQIEERNETI